MREGAKTGRRGVARRRAVGPLATVIVALVVAGVGTGCATRGPVDAGAEDRRIDAEVREIAAGVGGLDVEDLSVETRDGVVILSGVQSSWEAVSELLERISRVRGVLEVDNRIRVIREARPSDSREPPVATTAPQRPEAPRVAPGGPPVLDGLARRGPGA